MTIFKFWWWKAQIVQYVKPRGALKLVNFFILTLLKNKTKWNEMFKSRMRWNFPNPKTLDILI
jgi:hypothetical protein